MRRAILPDWWDERCPGDPHLVQDIEIRVARFLELSMSTVGNPGLPLEPPRHPGAQLRRVRDTDRARLAPAIHTAIRTAAAVVRNLRDRVPPPNDLPVDGLEWRERFIGARTAPSLESIAGHLWELGIPVVPLHVLPAPSFQGMACIVEDRPLILLGHKHDEPGRVAFVIAHEAGHIAAGDCAAGRPIVDEEPEIADDGAMERHADMYATRVLVGEAGVPQFGRHRLDAVQGFGAAGERNRTDEGCGCRFRDFLMGAPDRRPRDGRDGCQGPLPQHGRAEAITQAPEPLRGPHSRIGDRPLSAPVYPRRVGTP